MSDSDSDFDAMPTSSKAAAKKTTASAKAAPKKKPAGNSGGANNTVTEEELQNVFTDIDKAENKGKGMSIEEMYQKKSQLEHIMLRPDTYIGSVEFCDRTPMWIYDGEADKIVNREISYVPGLYKIFDEIVVNAADNKQRDPKMNMIKISINKEKNEISVTNNGRGIPVVMHKVEKLYVPEMIFGTLLTSSNYNDDEKKVTGGRNGYGAKLCNIFSTKFTLETASREHKKKFKQTWVNNMTKEKEPEIESFNGEDYTKVTFSPDLAKFKMTELDDDIVGLMSRRAYDIAGTTKGVKVYLNGKLIPCQGFKQYVEQYTRGVEYDGEPVKVAYEANGTRWDIAMTVSERGFQQVSFVNSIATTKGGRHVDYVADQIISKLIDTIKKKSGKSGINVKPFQVKNHLWVFVNCLIENPTFDSQTKETMTLQAKNFGSKCEPTEKFVKDALKCGVVEAVMSWVKFKQQEQQDKKCSTKKTSKLKGIPKLEDANDAGTKNSHLCTLILTEGDSAKSLAVAGLGVIGRDRYGVFPLRGKMLNVRDGSHKQIMENAEINAMLKIVGLQYKLKYATDEERKTLRYGKIMIMTDQDQDGSHIKGLLINFIHANWPNLIKANFLEEFITPIVKATKGKEERSFYSLPEYMEWRLNNDNWKSYKIKYYKGLGTSSAKEAKEYFSDMARHRIKFRYEGPNDDSAVEMAFSKKKIEDRKGWLTGWMQTRRERREAGEIEDYLYDKDTRDVSYADFVNKELILFSNMDNERSIPSLVDGFKPGQRKVMFTCFKRADKKEVKVAQLAGAVGEMSAYHHGEQSLMMTIINLAQDYVGSNNINLLMPNGQFGTRLLGGKDSASPRYIFTQLSPVAKTLFPPADEHVLRFLFEENQKIEPEWYCPIIPMVLVNGAEGIGTGWSTKIPNYNPRDIVKNIRRLIQGEELVKMQPWYKKFNGTISQIDSQRFACSGEIAIVNDDTVEITELPVKTWTQNYKENVLEPMMDGTPDKPALINDFKEYHTEETVKFLVKFAPGKLREAERQGLHNVFKLTTVINTTSMVLFDAAGVLRTFSSPEQICMEFFDTRKVKYIERKAFLEGMLQAQSDRLSEQARFILMKIKNEIHIENKKKQAIIEQLIKHDFKPDPVKQWKDVQRRKELEMCGEVDMEDEEENEENENDQLSRKVSDYDYLVGMAIWKLSMEDKDKLLAESEAKKDELKVLQSKSWDVLWEEDLKVFEEALEKQEKKEKADLDDCLKKAVAKLGKDKSDAGKRAGKKLAAGMADVKPNPDAIKVEVNLDVVKGKYETKAKKPKEPKEPKAPRATKKAKDLANNTSMDSFVTKKVKEEDDSDIEEVDKENEDKSKKAKKPAAKRAKSTPKKRKAASSDDDDEVVLSDEEEAMDVGTPPPKRETAPRRAAAAKKPIVLDEDSDEEVLPVKKQRRIVDSDDDFE
ncbi:unnamed protein product [Bursaphelenchus xylophilus]|uniref:DNA topoisomerase 2 n=1 Tax=Bursaphelenchus xylophilus TaxID=6326 RepID=A0A1I7S9S2_BURXY|nr:unnamed protein product [Bursaphelenchus xylophilus]CAG9129202.1 unnamed protein product [Bursaphelenchus xylophilus]